MYAHMQRGKIHDGYKSENPHQDDGTEKLLLFRIESYISLVMESAPSLGGSASPDPFLRIRTAACEGQPSKNNCVLHVC